MRKELTNAIKQVSVFHVTLVASAIGFFYAPQAFSWPLVVLVVSLLAVKSLSRFIPSREDQYLEALKQIEKELEQQRTEVSKLNLILGMGNIAKNRPSILENVLGQKPLNPVSKDRV